MYKYETHLHTYPVSKCAKDTVQQALEFYKSRGYAGVFVTNHFLCGNINCDKTLPYAEKIEFYFSDLESAQKIGNEIGLTVFGGVELSYKGTDFLVYGLGKDWYLAHPEIMEMKKSEELALIMNEPNTLVIQAHPFREASYIDHIRLFPRHVHGVEVINSSRTPQENQMAKLYAESYDLLQIAGSDHHSNVSKNPLAGIITEEKIKDEAHFVQLVKTGQTKIFSE